MILIFWMRQENDSTTRVCTASNYRLVHYCVSDGTKTRRPGPRWGLKTQSRRMSAQTGILRSRWNFSSHLGLNAHLTCIRFRKDLLCDRCSDGRRNRTTLSLRLISILAEWSGQYSNASAGLSSDACISVFMISRPIILWLVGPRPVQRKRSFFSSKIVQHSYIQHFIIDHSD